MNTPELDKIRMNQEFTAFLEPFFSNENNLNRWIPILEFKKHTKLTLSEIEGFLSVYFVDNKLEYRKDIYRKELPTTGSVKITRFLVFDFDSI